VTSIAGIWIRVYVLRIIVHPSAQAQQHLERRSFDDVAVRERAPVLQLPSREDEPLLD
jgi:hypothetical protein